MKKNLIIGILLGFFATFLMSHNACAAQRVGNYSNYVSNFSGLPTTIVNNRMYSISGTTNNLYIANGQYGYGINWQKGKTYHISLVVSVDGSGIYYVVPEAIHIDGDYYKSTNDNISSSVDCSSSTTCRYTVIHNIDVVATATGSEVIKTPTSNILNLASNGNYSGSVEMSTMLFDDEDEWAVFKQNVSQSLSDINSDTSDIVDTLGEINDKLDSLDSNADKNEQGWSNMQNTDGLIDVGDNTSFMDTFNSINSFFGGIKNVSATDCSFDFSNDVVDLGNLNFCSMPEALRNIISPIAAIIFAVVDIFLAWGSVKYIVSVIDWARRN